MATQKGQATRTRPSDGKGRGRSVITADTPLTPLEQKFVTNYVKCGIATQALKDAGIQLKDAEAYRNMSYEMMNQANIKAEVARIVEELRKDTIATAEEVMTYFTAVMRGEIKDQFGLEAPLSERTRAAQEMAKRTIDIENRQKGEPDTLIAVRLDWERH